MLGPEYFTVVAYSTDGGILCRKCGEQRNLPASDQLTEACAESNFQEDGLYCDNCQKEIIPPPEEEE